MTNKIFCIDKNTCKRNCPKCDNEIIHKGKQCRNNAYQSYKKLTLCKRCGYESVSKSVSGINHPMYGKKHTEKTKKHWSKIRVGRKLSKDTILKLKGRIPWMKGKHWSKKRKQEISKIHKGKKLSEETKHKIRLYRIKKMKLDGTMICKDEGSNEWFLNKNKVGFNFIQNFYLKKLGY